MTVMASSDFERAVGYITADTVRAALMSMIDIPSPTGGEGQLANYIESRLRAVGIHSFLQEVSDNRPNVVGVIPGAGDGCNILLTGHMDTSYDGDEEYLVGEGFKPKAVLRDGWIWGLGAVNMKGGLTAALIAVEAIARAGIRLRGDVTFGGVVGEIEKAPVEEFRGERFAGYGTGSRHLLLHGATADYAILAEHTGLKIGVANLGCLWAKITTRGTMAHSALANRPGVENAIEQMRGIQEALNQWAPIYEQSHQFMGERPNMTIAAIRGGLPWRLSRNPVECSLYLDVRTVPGQTAEGVKRALRAVLNRYTQQSNGAEPIVQYYLNDPPTAIDPDLPVVRALKQAHHNVVGRDVDLVTRRPAADSTHFSRYDIPCAVYGPGGRLHPDVHGQMHSAGEHIHVDDVVVAARVYLAAALDIANQIPMAKEVSN
jgi:acetylornithine deacetylase